MFALGIFFITLSLSIYLWGMVRTAIWMLPTLFSPVLGAVFAASLLSFWVLLAALTPYRSGGFDLRDFTRGRWASIFISSGIIAGSLLDPRAPIFILASAVSVPLILGVFRLCRFPASFVVYLPKKIRFVLIGLWLLAALLRVLESQMIAV